MFDRHVNARIQQYLDAHVRPRDRQLVDELEAIARKLSADGGLRSGRAIRLFSDAASDELDVRSGIIWTAVTRTHGAFVGRVDDATLPDLEQALSEHIASEAARIKRLTWDRIRAHQEDEAQLIDEVNRAAEELRLEWVLEAGFHVARMRQPDQAAGGAGVVVHGSVGVLQTGPYATAHVTLNRADTDRLHAALETFARAVAQNNEIANQSREEALDFIKDAAAATRADKPNPPKIRLLLGGLSDTVRTVASLKPAYEALRDVALAIGVFMQ